MISRLVSDKTFGGQKAVVGKEVLVMVINAGAKSLVPGLIFSIEEKEKDKSQRIFIRVPTKYMDLYEDSEQIKFVDTIFVSEIENMPLNSWTWPLHQR